MMFKLPLMLLLQRGMFLKTLREQGIAWTGIAAMAGFIAATCALYGAVMAFWSSPLLALYSAAKLPLVFAGSTAAVAIFNWMVAAALGSGLAFRETVALTFASMVVACWMLLALAPVEVFFILTGAPEVAMATEAEVDFAYRVTLLSHVGVLAAAGVVGNASLFNGLRAVVKPGCPAGGLFAAWVALFAIVGCQASWILSPFVGHPLLEKVFFCKENLDTNFIEVVFNRLLPSFLTGKRLW